jgi:hypothetical protein
MAITPRLDNLAAMQSRPMGTNTALYRDPSSLAVGRQYKQQKSDYDMARRLLRRQARRGDSSAATALVGLGKDAAANDVEFGMQNVEQRDAAIAGRTAGMKQETVDALNKQRVNRGLVAGRPTANEPPATPVSLGEDSIGAGYSKDVGDKRGTELTTPLGQRAAYARSAAQEGSPVFDPTLGSLAGGDDPNKKNLIFRQGLDRALGMAKTDAERKELGIVAKDAGISDEAFKRRTDWWNKKR